MNTLPSDRLNDDDTDRYTVHFDTARVHLDNAHADIIAGAAAIIPFADSPLIPASHAAFAALLDAAGELALTLQYNGATETVVGRVHLAPAVAALATLTTAADGGGTDYIGAALAALAAALYDGRTGTGGAGSPSDRDASVSADALADALGAAAAAARADAHRLAIRGGRINR